MANHIIAFLHNRPVPHIRDYHGIEDTARPLLEYCPDAMQCTMEGFCCAFGADSNQHATFWCCPHSGRIMMACKYCDHWYICIEQTFIEHHLLGSHDEIPECENVSKYNKFVSFLH
jgi:hypothetical protein